MGTLFLSAVAIVLLAVFFVIELRTGSTRPAEALYLVRRVAERYGFEVREQPLSLVVPWSHDGAELHYHLLRPGGERDSIALVARRGDKSRLGNLMIANDLMMAAGLEGLMIGAAQFDRYFRIFTEHDRKTMVMNLVEQSSEILFVVKDLACRSRAGSFELMDIDGHLKIQFSDRSLRFPSDVEKVTLDLVRLYQLYLVLSGACHERDLPAAASVAAQG